MTVDSLVAIYFMLQLKRIKRQKKGRNAPKPTAESKSPVQTGVKLTAKVNHDHEPVGQSGSKFSSLFKNNPEIPHVPR